MGPMREGVPQTHGGGTNEHRGHPMTGIHHIAPTIYLSATRHDVPGDDRRVRRPSRLLLACRRVAARAAATRMPRWVDATPASTAP